MITIKMSDISTKY